MPARRVQPNAARPTWLLLMVASILLSAEVYLFVDYSIGDGFITARYAENLVDRGEIAFNAGEHVSALTSPLHMLVLAVGYGLGADTLVFNKALALTCVLAGTLALATAFAHLPVRRVMAVYLTALSPFLLMWTFSGLETAYVFAGVAVFCLIMMKAERDLANARHALSVGLIAAGLFGLRYETVLLTAPAGLFLLLGASNRTHALVRLAPGALLACGWLAFATAYFGDPLPTSFYVKTPAYDARTLLNNGLYTLQFVVLAGLWAIPLLTRRRRAEAGSGPARTVKRWWVPAALTLLGLYWLGAATKHMMYGYRIFLPYLPLLVVAWQWPPPTADAPAGRFGWRRAGALLLLGLGQFALALVVFGASVNPSFVGEFRQRSAASQMPLDMHAQARRTVAVLRAHFRGQARAEARAPRLFTREAGLLPYHFREAMVLDPDLISYRHRCRPDPREAADYIEVWYPAWGPLGHQLPATASELALVWPARLPTEGAPFRAIFFNPTPAPYRLPPRITGACIGQVESSASAPSSGR